jgi:hypothetical protein
MFNHFRQRIRQLIVRNSTEPTAQANIRQEAKTERARANRKRLNASRKANRGNQFRGGQNKKKVRKAPKPQIVRRWNLQFVPLLVLDNEAPALEGVMA